jgi:hypothetical protein
VFRIQIHLSRIRIQHLRLNTDWIQGFKDKKSIKKFTAEKREFFVLSKMSTYLSLGLHKGRPSYRRSLQPSKKNIQQFKTSNFSVFFYFGWTFLPSWILVRNTVVVDMKFFIPDPKPALHLVSSDTPKLSPSDF